MHVIINLAIAGVLITLAMSLGSMIIAGVTFVFLGIAIVISTAFTAVARAIKRSMQ